MKGDDFCVNETADEELAKEVRGQAFAEFLQNCRIKTNSNLSTDLNTFFWFLNMFGGIVHPHTPHPEDSHFSFIVSLNDKQNFV